MFILEQYLLELEQLHSGNATWQANVGQVRYINSIYAKVSHVQIAWAGNVAKHCTRVVCIYACDLRYGQAVVSSSFS